MTENQRDLRARREPTSKALRNATVKPKFEPVQRSHLTPEKF